MRFDLNEDQATFATFLGQMLQGQEAEFRTVPGWGRFDYGHALDDRLAENGFFDVATEETLGPVTAASLVYEIARLPVAVECAASAMLRTELAPDLPRPVAVLTGAGRAPLRFLPVARSVLWLADGRLRAATLEDVNVEPVESLFAYPMAHLDPEELDWQDLPGDPARALDLWRVAVAAEIAGALKGGLDAVLEHLRERHQFGRPLGSFQALQHRLARAAVEIEAARWLALRAAQTGAAADAAVALGHAQSVATRIGYDLHQFMGAMGLTLEHPLHRWTYRVRLLRSTLGGAARAFQALADARWGAA